MKKIVSLLIVIAMLAGMVPAVVAGAEEISGTMYTETTLTSGTYILVDGNGYAPTVLDGSWILSAVATISGDTASGVSTWALTVDGTNVKLCDANGSYVAPKGGNTNGITTGEYDWTWIYNGDGTYSFAGQGDDTVMLAGNAGSDNKYRAYRNTTLTGSYAASYTSTFTLYKVSDSIETPEQPEEPETPVVDEPAADSTLTIADAIALGLTKDSNSYTEGKYYVTGVITEVYNTTYGNMRITDEAGNILTIYGTFNADGTVRYDALETMPVAGDTVTLYGIIGQYNGAAQMMNGWIVEHIAAATADPEADTELTIPEANALGASKEHNNYTAGKYYVTGVITSVVNSIYGNVYIEDAQGNSLYVYGLYSSDGSIRYDAMDPQPQVGDVITVYGIIGQYKDTPQMKNAWVVKIAPVFVVDEVTTNPGSTVDVTIAVKNNPGIASIKLSVAYADVLTLDSIVYNSAIGGMSQQPQKMDSPVTLNWFNGVADSFGDWILATLTFTVAEDAAFGEYSISITYNPDDVYNIAETNIEFMIQNGGVTVVCPHTNKQYVAVVETGCETQGCLEHYTCPDCGAILEADGVTETTLDALIREPLGHVGEEFVEIELEPGCETEGAQKVTTVCHNCGEELSVEYLPIEPTGHDYKAVVTDPTCEDQGYTTHTCANCGHSYVDSYVDANGHTYGEWFEIAAPGCETEGTERRNCADCDHYETRDVEPTGHDYKAVVTDPTCTEQGYTTHTCANCDHSYVDSYVDALGHSYVDGECVHCGAVDGTSEFPLGDVNMNGEVDTTDAYLIVQYYNELMDLTPEQLALADVDGNGEVDTTDAYWIVQYYNERIDKFPGEE